MTWFYSKGGQQLGPISEEELSRKLAQGELSTTDLVWKEGMPDWTPLEKVTRRAAGARPPVMRSKEGSVMIPQPPMRSAAELPSHVPTYLWQSIIVTLFCFMPFGVVAIVYASEVDSHTSRGDFERARAASNSAKMWVSISAGTFLLFLVGVIIYVGISANGWKTP